MRNRDAGEIVLLSRRERAHSRSHRLFTAVYSDCLTADSLKLARLVFHAARIAAGNH